MNFATRVNSSGFTGDDEKTPWHNVRLPSTVVPIRYEVDLKPVLTPDDSGLYWFYGSSSVVFTVLKNTTTILLHSSKLHYTRINVTGTNVSGVCMASISRIAILISKMTYIRFSVLFIIV